MKSEVKKGGREMNIGFTSREFWTIIHGMVFGGLLLLPFPAILVALWDLRSGSLTDTIRKRRFRLLMISLYIMTFLAWLTILSGTYFPYPWYRAIPPDQADILKYPQAYLYSNPNLSFWEDYGMEWKEHFGWFIPILLTTVSFIFTRFGTRAVYDTKIFRAIMTFLLIAFTATVVSGIIGALVTKIAPVR